jgi:NAD-dependent dihydropyrimidine dehydrogenase PreA subunit
MNNMSQKKLTVVLSQAQGKDPVRRAIEEEIAAALLMEPGVDLGIVPALYDLHQGHTGRLYLEGIQGDMVVISWLYPRAAYWLLDRDGIQGQLGETNIKPAEDNDDDEETEEVAKPKGIGAVKFKDRLIYCLDLRDAKDHRVYVNEVRRILGECRKRWDASGENSKPAIVQLGMNISNPASSSNVVNGINFPKEEMLKVPGRRWYPVIDYSRCTNCMECLDFCLFGVYGVDSLERIYVDNQDSCKKGCPACSRVCPEQAIMFPDYKSPAIAGAPVGAISGLKIDLTKLFGGGDALVLAAKERDKELVRDGRDAVGLSVGIPKRQSDKKDSPKDDLDNLMDSLDTLEI